MIREFTDLIAWQKGHELVLEIYRVTNSFPDLERFGLISQMRRSAASITANIAEGFGRRGMADKVRFYDISMGSLYELQDQLLISVDVKYLQEEDYLLCKRLAGDTQRLIKGLIGSIRKLQR
ncbi:four helix bundle protein [Candidatus Uhrbacteria bacterium]|jgi:four helix bundle protein|nr:four helix bundle protein [Candidatus Uhrbacteria bacterium]